MEDAVLRLRQRLADWLSPAPGGYVDVRPLRPLVEEVMTVVASRNGESEVAMLALQDAIWGLSMLAQRDGEPHLVAANVSAALTKALGPDLDRRKEGGGSVPSLAELRARLDSAFLMLKRPAR
jgi:hypothetical protein